MSMVFSLYVASLKEYVRDRLTLFWTLAFPVLFIVMFGVIFSGGGSNTYSVGLVNLDNGPLGQSLVQAFTSPDIKKVFQVTNGATIDAENHFQDQLKNGKLDLVIVIPADLSQNAQVKTPTNLQIYSDESKQPQAQIKEGIAAQIVANMNRGLSHTTDILGAETHSVNTTSLSAIDYLVPGILAMSLMQLGLFGTAMPLVSLRERKILRRLGATPLPRSSILMSQVFLRLTIAVIQTALIVGIGALAFHVQIEHPLQAIGVVLIGALMFISLGYFIASIATTQESANGITSAINFPMLFLSGIFFSLSALPTFLTPIVRALPLTYLADALRQTMINSTPDFPMMTDLLVLVAWIIGCLALSTRLFKWE